MNLSKLDHEAPRVAITGKMLAIVCAIVAVVVVLDQATKFMILWYLPPEGFPVIPGFFDLTLAYNKGAAFGMLADLPDGTRQILLALTTILALIAVVFLLWRYYIGSCLGTFALSMVLGGAIGNIIDRVRIGMVVDFLDFYWGLYHYPAFNIADSAICIGVAILFFLKPAGLKDSAAEPAAGSETV